MKLEEALKLVKPGEYIKAIGDGWSEYTIQFGLSKDGNYLWTAGNTCGGFCSQEELLRMDKSNKDFYEIYSYFYSNSPRLT